MKVTIKILILVLSIALAIGGIMVYAKTRVEPPTTFQPINQFERDLNQTYSKLRNAESVRQEDSIYIQTIDRISVFEKENRLTHAESDQHRDKLLGCYSPRFLKRCFSKFNNSIWNTADHNYMLTISNRLQSVKHSDESLVLQKNTLDSLALVEKIIANYRHAKAISRSTTYRGITSAQSIINQANNFANDKYLSKCTNLRNALNNVKTNIGQSHYIYISSLVEKLSEFRYYGQQYYENTLVPQVDAAVTEYDNKATALYGSKKDVNALWNRAREYYIEASDYYNNNNY